jgi:hypothetical protein
LGQFAVVPSINLLNHPRKMRGEGAGEIPIPEVFWRIKQRGIVADQSVDSLRQ